MHIVLVSSEIVPFAKTGGLADVAGALPRELEALGHTVTLFMPAYPGIYQVAQGAQGAQPDGNVDFIKIEPTNVELTIPLGDHPLKGGLKRCKLPGCNADVFFVDQPELFDRSSLYGEGGQDYRDNCRRFTFFCRAVLESIRLLNLPTDLIHCNDWQTGLIPALLKCEYNDNPNYRNIACLLTIHNLAYQGVFDRAEMHTTGLDWKFFNWQQLEFFGQLNLLKTGIVFADAINTVSPTYAREIQTPAQGCGLEGVLQHRASRLAGILNGIDTNEWNPATDPLLPFNFSANFDLDEGCQGKQQCKAALQTEVRLEPKPDTPLIGIVGRLASQKGWSLILPLLRHWLEHVDAQWIILGTGDPDYHHVLTTLHRSFPHKLAVNLGFSNEYAHRIEAGADLFLMPSEYEPCGLNQMYSMAYGTLPVVRRTGGLADTVVNATPETIGNGTANGFSFPDFSVTGLQQAVGFAVGMYRDQRRTWHQLMQTGMNTDWSWKASAEKYSQLYQRAIQFKLEERK